MNYELLVDGRVVGLRRTGHGAVVLAWWPGRWLPAQSISYEHRQRACFQIRLGDRIVATMAPGANTFTWG